MALEKSDGNLKSGRLSLAEKNGPVHTPVYSLSMLEVECIARRMSSLRCGEEALTRLRGEAVFQWRKQIRRLSQAVVTALRIPPADSGFALGGYRCCQWV
jgi:hypothetical protein